MNLDVRSDEVGSKKLEVKGDKNSSWKLKAIKIETGS